MQYLQLVRKETDDAFISMMGILVKELAARGVSLPSGSLTVLDVGAGHMPYGLALERWAQQQAQQVRVVAIDKRYNESEYYFYPKEFSNHSNIEQIAAPVEQALGKLRAAGVAGIDLITMFNVYPTALSRGVISGVRSLEELCKDTHKGVPVVGAVDEPWHVYLFEKELSGLGYEFWHWHNPHAQPLSEGFGYSRLFVAVPKLRG